MSNTEISKSKRENSKDEKLDILIHHSHILLVRKKKSKETRLKLFYIYYVTKKMTSI